MIKNCGTMADEITAIERQIALLLKKVQELKKHTIVATSSRANRKSAPRVIHATMKTKATKETPSSRNILVTVANLPKGITPQQIKTELFSRFLADIKRIILKGHVWHITMSSMGKAKELVSIYHEAKVNGRSISCRLGPVAADSTQGSQPKRSTARRLAKPKVIKA